MYRAVLPTGEVECESYEMIDHGIELYDETGEMIAFTPYHNLHVLINEELEPAKEPDEHTMM